jgi:hypothetical protein
MVLTPDELNLLRKVTQSLVFDPNIAEDVYQQSVVHILERPEIEFFVYRFVVRNAYRTLQGRPNRRFGYAIRNPAPLPNPDWIASCYPTEAELLERWLDEETEDQTKEFETLKDSDKSNRMREAAKGLGSSIKQETGYEI